jgi:hypothetical protein
MTISNGEGGLSARNDINNRLAGRTRTAIKALDPAAYPVVRVSEAGRQGVYFWDAAVTIATHQADPAEYSYIAPNPAANGAWVRERSIGLTSLVTPESVRDLRGIAKGENAIETVSELTDPTLASNVGRRVILAGQPPIMAYCDGVKWWDLTGGAEISPWWLPRGAVLHVDFENSRFYWDGAVKALGDLTDEGSGGYSISSYGFGYNGVACVMIDYSPTTDISNWTGDLFSWSRSTVDRVEFGVGNNDTNGDGVRLYIAPGNPSANFDPIAPQSISGEGGAVWLRDERRRVFARIKNNSNSFFQADNGQSRNGGAAGAGALGVPTKIGFKWNARFGGAATNVDLHRVTIWNVELSTPHIQAVGRAGTAKPVHLIGDSFLNVYGVGTRFMQLCSNASKIVPFSQDGVGGTTLTQQAARFEAYAGNDRAKWWDSTLVICEFGPEDSAQAQIEAIKRMLRLLRHDRWLYMQPAPSTTLSPVTNLPEKDAIMRAWCGDHFVSTLQEAWDEGDGSSTDNDQIALGRWPVSLTISAADFHPNNAGQIFIAQRIYDELLARGWI